MAAGQAIVDEALSGLVHQFADPMACFRELVQNAIDAGSTEVDVRFAHEGGRLVVDVDDYGDGMDRQIIDTRLTRLFSSSKDDDRTKIGRFGIGFVSVFALEPDVIRIDTSRAGEHWRLIFRPDRSFTRVARDEPVDGTKIRIYKEMSAEDAARFARRATDAIAYWCRHVGVTIRVDGRVINEPFDVPAACKVTKEVGEARIVAGYSYGEPGRIGYYNRGLTLLEEASLEFLGVHLKLWSPALEHTMTRDNVLRDQGYERVMAHARELVRGPLRARLFDVVATDVPALHQYRDAHDHLYPHVAALLSGGETLPRAARKRPFVRTIGGAVVDLNTIVKAGKKQRLWYAEARSPATDLLQAAGHVIVALAGPSAMLSLVYAAGVDVESVNARWCTAAVKPPPHPPGFRELASAVRVLAAAIQPIAGVALGALDYPGSPVAERVAIAQDKPGGLTPLLEAAKLTANSHLVLSAGHPAVADALALAPHEPEFAAATLLRLFLLETHEFSLARATTLAQVTQETRWRRTT